MQTSMKYKKVIDKVNSGTMPRDDLVGLKLNAEKMLANGDQDARAVLSAINIATPADSHILFMGFCPDADTNNRLDIDWKAKGICRFDYRESESQAARFDTMCTGDLVVLKKREVFGKTMKLYGHGRVISVAYDEKNIRFLVMNWSDQSGTIEVPLLGCNSTVDVRSIDVVEAEMPDEFWHWLKG
jgi:hypothetical protein